MKKLNTWIPVNNKNIVDEFKAEKDTLIYKKLKSMLDLTLNDKPTRLQEYNSDIVNS